MSGTTPALLGVFLVFFINSFEVNDAATISNDKSKICIIGAGPTGLASTKLFSDKSDKYDIITFEQKSNVGGLWIYSDNVESDEHGLPVHSSVYKSLMTNIPKQLMSWPDYIKPEGKESGVVSHEEFLKYLRDYTEEFNLRKYIQFDTLVEKVTPLAGDGDRLSTKWSVQTKNLNNNEKHVTTCDAVLVCNGHEFAPKIPVISGIETFPGKVMHSHLYRVPNGFEGQRVVILGAGPSGFDLAGEISQVAKKLYFSHNLPRSNAPMPQNMAQVAGVVGANGSELILKDGSKIEADAIVYCTGYLYVYPFLDETSGITVEDNQIQYLYKHIVNVKFPTMGFIGIPYVPISYPIHYTAIRFFMSLLEGKTALPSETEMLEDIKKDLGTKKQRHAHKYNEFDQWAYSNEVERMANIEPTPDIYKIGGPYWVSYAWANAITFRSKNLRFLDNGEPKLVPRNQV